MFDPQNLSVVVIGLAIAEIVALLLVVDVVMRPRSSQGAIAWSIALVALPLLTIPLYLIFGRTRFQGYAELVARKGHALAHQENLGHEP